MLTETLLRSSVYVNIKRPDDPPV